MSTKKKTTTITEQRIKSPKIWLLVCSIIALICDIAMFGVLLTNSLEFKFWICPMIIMVLDTFFIFKVIFSNYRFKYAFKDMIVHIVLVILMCALAIVTTGYLEDRIVFEDLAFYAMPAIHLIQCFSTLFIALFASRKKRAFYRVSSIVLTVLFTASVGLYGNFLFTRGFFGQGFFKENRTVVYSFDEGKNHYVATGVLNGLGRKVVIPDEFNGLPVGGIDCDLFTTKGITTIQLDCATSVKLTNLEALAELNGDVKILTAKDKMDDFRMLAYSLATAENTAPIDLGNKINPSDLEKDEIYLAFSYTYDALQTVKGEVIPTWFASSGTVFNLKSHAGNVPYIEHSDVNNEADLHFCYGQQGGKIFRLFADGESGAVDGVSHKASADVQVTFDKIYRLEIAEDNDSKYNIASDYRFFTVDGVKGADYRYATSDKIQAMLDAHPTRNGFTFAWSVGSDKHALENLAGELAALDTANKDILQLTPVWELKAPVITTLTADGVSETHSVIYGNTVNFNSAATSPDDTISLRYEWKHQSSDKELPAASAHSIANWHPENAGDYTLTVTAYSDTVTSLTAAVSQTIKVEFQKKELGFTWSLEQGIDTVYSALDKTIVAQAVSGQVINQDNITFNLSQYTVRNAGKYTIDLTLTGDADTKYYVPDASKSYDITITPYTIDVVWGNDSFVYNGTLVAPEASFTGLENDGKIILTVDGQKKNVGTYTATATTTNTNYTLAKDTKTYYITQRPITIVSWDKESWVYNGFAQHSNVSAVDNAVAGEESSVIAEMIYDRTGTSVGAYETTATLPATSNYKLEGNTDTSFNITPAPLKVTINNKSIVYSGLEFTGFDFSTTGLVGNDTIEQVLSLIYKDEAVTATDVRANAYKIDADPNPYDKFSNYEVEIHPGNLTINKMKLDIYLTDASKIYDGNVYSDFRYTCSDLAVTDKPNEIFTLSFIGEAVSAVNYSAKNYVIDATTAPEDKYNNYEIIIHTAILTIEKAPLTVSAIGTGKTYDGTAGSGFTIEVNGLVNNETVESLGTPIYGGAARNNRNVGEHELTVYFNSNSVTNNYNITYEKGTYVIMPKDLTITANSGTKIYNGLIGGSFDFTADGLVASDTKAQLGTPVYGGTAATAKNVGSYKLTVELPPENTIVKNYSITYIEGDFDITPKSLTVYATSTSKTYNAEIGGTFDFSVYGLVSGDSKADLGNATYSGNATTAVNVGTYTLNVALEGNANYEITSYIEGSFTINPKLVTITPTSTSREYDGVTVGSTSFDFKADGLVGNDTKDILGVPTFGGAAINAKNAGNYDLTVSLNYDAAVKNYELSYNTGRFDIQKKPLTVTAIGNSKVYDGKLALTSEFDFSVIGLVAGETKESLGTPTYNGDATTNKNVGEHTLTLTFTGNAVTNNYEITYVDAKYIITKANLTVSATDGTKVYDGKITTASGFKFTVTGLVAGETEAILGTPAFEGTATTNKNAGTYVLSVKLPVNTATNNYNITYVDAKYTITKKDLTVIANNGTKVYDGKVATPADFSFSLQGLVASDTKEMLGTPMYNCAATTNKNVGTYALSLTLPDATVNYNVKYEEATYTITQKDLMVMADNGTKVYDGKITDAADFSYTVSGAVENDKIGTPRYYGTATENKNAGTYELQVELVGGTDISNYKVTYTKATYTITKADLTAYAVAEDRAYNKDVKGGTFSVRYEGLVAGEDPGSFLAPSYGGDAINAVDAGTYTLTINIIDTTLNANYNITCVPDEEFVISAAPEVSE